MTLNYCLHPNFTELKNSTQSMSSPHIRKKFTPGTIFSLRDPSQCLGNFREKKISLVGYLPSHFPEVFLHISNSLTFDLKVRTLVIK